MTNTAWETVSFLSKHVHHRCTTSGVLSGYYGSDAKLFLTPERLQRTEDYYGHLSDVPTLEDNRALVVDDLEDAIYNSTNTPQLTIFLQCRVNEGIEVSEDEVMSLSTFNSLLDYYQATSSGTLVVIAGFDAAADFVDAVCSGTNRVVVVAGRNYFPYVSSNGYVSYLFDFMGHADSHDSLLACHLKATQYITNMYPNQDPYMSDPDNIAPTFYL